MKMEKLLETLEGDAVERLRWKLCRLFGVAPWSRLGQSLTEEQCLELAAHWVLDSREQRGQSPENPGFDMDRFRKLKGEL